MAYSAYDGCEVGDDVAILIRLVLLGLLLILGIRLLRPSISYKNKAVSGMALGRMIYSDEVGGKLLVSDKYGLQGKPDFIFETLFTHRLVPFEIKSGQCKDTEPHEGDLMQLVAYFVIIQEVYGKKPPFGKLVYQNKTFKVRNTLGLRHSLKDTVRQMHKMLEGHSSLQASPSFAKCRNCVCQKTVCEWEE
ncbi:MAG: CRISPR-associated protein Cas4 [Cellulosilyticaceae bacterium]